jgi:hypothetical protein
MMKKGGRKNGNLGIIIFQNIVFPSADKSVETHKLCLSAIKNTTDIK